MNNPRPTFYPDLELAAFNRAAYAASVGDRATADQYVAAAGGSEVPCLVLGRWVLRVYNPWTGEGGSYDFATDIVTLDCEVLA